MPLSSLRRFAPAPGSPAGWAPSTDGSSQVGIDLAVVERDGETVVTVGGALDGDGAWRIRECLAELIAARPRRRLLLDVGKVHLTDFLAVSVLIGALTQCRSVSEVELWPPDCRTYRILRRAGAPGARHDPPPGGPRH